MKVYQFKGLLQEEGWISPAFVSVSKKGKIKSISNEYKGRNVLKNINGYALPGFQNAHSHAFQYAMAGLAEKHDLDAETDDFWSWREEMYNLALKVRPKQLENIATMLYSEMIRHGYTHVAEFHYLHHDVNGNQYPKLAEMGRSLIKAAKRSGINITLIPIFYQMGGFGKSSTDKQKRFISSSVEDYLKLLKASKKACKSYSGANIGVGIHSLRGVKGDDIVKVSEHEDTQNLPFHIHIAEQLKEIEDSIAYQGLRPVEWILKNVVLSNRYHLVHATHLTTEETEGIAKANANVVLCPSTEGNLGDGIFPLDLFQKLNGNWSIGTDSHIGINPLEELRLLDYGQRLTGHKRNIYTSKTEGNSADFALKMNLIAGRKAMGNNQTDFFEIGTRFNASVYDADAPLLSVSSLENLTNTILYACDSSTQLATISNGKLVSYRGVHKNGSEIMTQFRESMEELGNR